MYSFNLLDGLKGFNIMPYQIYKITPKESYRIAKLITKTGKPHVSRLIFGYDNERLWTEITFENHYSVENKRKVLLWAEASTNIPKLIKICKDKIESDKYEKKLKSLSYQYSQISFINPKVEIEKSPWYKRIFK